MLTLDKIYHASYVLKDVIRRTELIPAPYLNKKGNIFIKPENLQLTGSFKVQLFFYIVHVAVKKSFIFFVFII